MKISQRLDYNRLAEVLTELDVIDSAALQLILQQSFNNGELFPEVLVRDGLIPDWELSRIACEAFHLVFLSVDFYEPSNKISDLIDRRILHRHCLVPLDCFDDLVTIAMPALTPSEVLSELEEQIEKSIQVVVGTAASNRRWLTENLPIEASLEEVSGALPEGVDNTWGSVFDEGDAAVLMDLNGEAGADTPEAGDVTAEVTELDDQTSVDGLDGLDGLIS